MGVNMDAGEIVARLDVLQGESERLTQSIRELKYQVFETLDQDPDVMVG